jgi:hypothetical protein
MSIESILKRISPEPSFEAPAVILKMGKAHGSVIGLGVIQIFVVPPHSTVFKHTPIVYREVCIVSVENSSFPYLLYRTIPRSFLWRIPIN